MKFLFLLLVLSVSPLKIYAQPPGYNYGKLIALEESQMSGTTSFTNFVILVNTVDPDLRTTANGGRVENSNGYDIIFTMDDCSTPLDHQIERYNPVTGEYIAWVRIPSLNPTSDHYIAMYYGNPAIGTDPSTTTTWNSFLGKSAIYHMDNDMSTSSLIDNSGQGVNGYDFGTMDAAARINGKIGYALDFNNADYIALNNLSYTGLGEIDTLTVSSWIRTSFVGTPVGVWENWAIVDFDRSEYFNFYITRFGRLGFSSAKDSITDFETLISNQLNDGAWHYACAVYDQDSISLYIDGDLANRQSNRHFPGMGTGNLRYGFLGDGSEAGAYNGTRNELYYDGEMDEVRFGDFHLSSDWIKTEYNNQNDPSTFMTFGPEEAPGDVCTILPIELHYFEAIPIGDSAHLIWETLSEKDNMYFTLEKSVNGTDWIEIGRIEGNGNSSGKNYYDQWDQDKYKGTTYYRLSQTDMNGINNELKTVSLLCKESENLKLINNLSDSYIEVRSTQLIQLSDWKIYDISGRELTEKVPFKRLSETAARMDISFLSTGLYWLVTPNYSICFEKI